MTDKFLYDLDTYVQQKEGISKKSSLIYGVVVNVFFFGKTACLVIRGNLSKKL